tara:strand:+ start:7995 stop:9482 length:1488 start_codon:yes stop_codon:yes gene_type:complete
MTTRVRVRFAPSPTGEPHVGNVRTAIFDWLFARHHGGDFVIRVEDTDQARKTEGATELMLESLKWLGLEWDEGPDVGGPHEPYHQSQRLEYYRDAIESLLSAGSAYRCFCSPDRLTALREQQQKDDSDRIGYDGKCRDVDADASRDRAASGQSSVVRFKMPENGITEAIDIIRGNVSFENALYDDFVMLKSDGYPTYHLANVVDDHHMQITHVTRAVEWLSSLPLHVQLYRALGWDAPEFVHLPLILAADRTKLSKRHGATSVLEFREMGVLPETLLNFLALLGWSLDDKTEIFAPEQLIEHFTLDRVGRSDAVFDFEKLNWMNGVHIREASPDRLADALLDHWTQYPPDEFPKTPDREFALRIVPLIHDRIKSLPEAAPLVSFLLRERIDYDNEELIQKGMDIESTCSVLQASQEGLALLEAFDSEAIEALLRPMAKELDVNVGQVLGTLRVAATGLKVSPPIFETLEAMGQERAVRSIHAALDRLQTGATRYS